MGSEDLINIQSSCSSGNRSDNNDLSSADGEPSVADSLPSNSKVKEDQLNGNFPGNENAVGNKDTQSLASEIHKDLIDSTTVNQVSVELTEAFEIQGKMNSFISTVHTENGCLNVQDESSVGMLKRDRSSISCQEKDSNSCQPYLVSRDLKWPFMRNKLQFMSCIIPYKDSKRKLEKLLQQWSEWHAGHYPSSHDSNEVLESGEETYFPALHVGVDNPSAVSFWMDSQTRDPQSKEIITLDIYSVPLYDRGYALGLIPTDGSGNLGRGMEIVDVSRCFNCGSYNHSLKECPKPCDNVAVSNACKQQKSRHKQKASSRNPTRYYQSCPGGKYDGLKPGVLDAETRQLLGLGVR